MQKTGFEKTLRVPVHTRSQKDLLIGSSNYMLPGFIRFVSHFNVYEIGFVLDSMCAFNVVVCFIPRKVGIKPLVDLSIKVPQKAM